MESGGLVSDELVVAVDQDAAKQTMRVAELHGGSQLRAHSYY